MKKIILLSIIFICYSLVAKSQSTYNLDLEKSIDIAKLKSYSMLKLTQDFKISEYNLKSATSSLKTHITLNLEGPNYAKDVQSYITDSSSTYFTSKRLQYGGNLLIKQPLPTAGYVSIQTGLYNKDTYTLNQRSPNLYTTFNFEQPLTALYGYNSVKSYLKKAELAYEQSKKALKREELNLIYIVSNSFYGYLSAQKRTEIAKLDLDRQKDAFDISQNKFKAGLIKEVDALQMEVDLAEAQNNFDLAIINQSSTQNEFKQLIGINLNDSVLVSGKFTYIPVIVNADKAVQLALQNRLEIREQEIQIEQSKLNVKEQKSNGMIQSSLNLSFGKSGYSYQDLNSSLTNALNNTYSKYLERSPDYSIGLSVKVPILDFGENRAKVKAAEAGLKQNELQKIEVQRNIEREVRNMVAELNSSLKRLQLLEKNIIVAEKSFDITRQRFSDGDIDSQGLALERKRLNTAYTSHLSAYVSYQLYLADLMRKTFYDFQNNQPIK